MRDMPDALRHFVFLALVPTIAAIGLPIILWRVNCSTVRRHALSLPLAVAFVLSYLLPPDQTWLVFERPAAEKAADATNEKRPNPVSLVPKRHWQWLPYLALGTALIGATIAASGVAIGERVLVIAILMFVCAYQLVPTWETLVPARPTMVLILTIYLTLTYLVASLLPERLRGRPLLFQTSGVLLAVATYVIIEISLKIGFTIVPAAAALGGVWLASLFFKWDDESLTPMAQSVLALLPAFCVLAGGGAFVGAIELPDRRYLLLLIPAAPLTLWLFTFGPLAKLQGITAIVAQTAAVAIIPVAVLAWTLLKPEPADEWSNRLVPLPTHIAFSNLHFSFFNLRV